MNAKRVESQMKNTDLTPFVIPDIADPFDKTLQAISSVQLTAERRATELITQQMAQIDIASRFTVPGIMQANKMFENILPFRAEQIFGIHQAMEDAAAKMSGRFLDMQRAVEETSKAFSGQLRGIVEIGQQFAASIEQFRDPLVRLSESIAAMQDAALSHLSHLPHDFGVLFERFKEVQTQAFALFAELGLPSLEFSLTAYDFKMILEIQAEQGNDAALSYIFEIFREDDYFLLNQMVSTWTDTPYMADRQKGVRSAIEAHKRGEYELTISTLLPLIDGLSAEIVSQFPNRKGRKAIYVTDVVRIYKEIEPEIASECLVQVVEKVLFQNVDFGTAPIPSSNNRHAILHGRVSDFGTELCSYQVILLLHAIVHISQQVLIPIV
jgi:hypothetical protein